MPHAVIVAHGQPSAPEPAEAALADFARRVGAQTPNVSVHSATLAAPGRLEQVLEQLPEDCVIYPLFMAKGWFVTGALPKRIGDRDIPVMDPLGVDPELPSLAAAALSDSLDKFGWAAGGTNLVLAAHGSGRSRNPARVAQSFAAELNRALPLAAIRVGFVEEAPSIVEAARDAGAQSLCLPFFACLGGHAQEDVPQALAEAGFRGHVLPVLGELPPIPAHIGKRIEAYFAGHGV